MTRIVKTLTNENITPAVLPVLATEAFLSLKSYDYGYVISDNFLLPFYCTTKVGIKRAFFTTATIALTTETSIDDEKRFLSEAITACRKHAIAMIDVPMVNALFNTYPDKAISAEFGSYIVDLGVDEETLLKNLHSKHRNVVKKAQKDGVVIKTSHEYKDICLSLIADTYQRQHKPFNEHAYITRMTERLNENISFYIAEKEGIIQGCAVFLWNKEHSCNYLFGGSIPRPSTGSLNLLQYQAMLDMKQNGVKTYDFFGARVQPEKNSKLEGIQRFKSRFGAELKTGYLWKYDINPGKARMFRLLMKIRLILKGKSYKGDIIDQERKRR